MSYGTIEYELSSAEGSFVRMDLNASPSGSDPWDRFLPQWVDYILGGAEPSFSGRRNLRVLELIEAAHESIKKGAVVRVPAPCAN